MLCVETANGGETRYMTFKEEKRFQKNNVLYKYSTNDPYKIKIYYLLDDPWTHKAPGCDRDLWLYLYFYFKKVEKIYVYIYTYKYTHIKTQTQIYINICTHIHYQSKIFSVP